MLEFAALKPRRDGVSGRYFNPFLQEQADRKEGLSWTGQAPDQFAGNSLSADRRVEMKIHEYQAKEVLRKFGVPTPKGIPCFSVDEAVKAAYGLPWPGEFAACSV